MEAFLLSWLLPLWVWKWMLVHALFQKCATTNNINFIIGKTSNHSIKCTWSISFCELSVLWGGFNVTFLGCSHDIHCWPLTPLSSFPGRPIPPTSSSSLLPSAQLPSSHNPPPVSCQMPLLDSNTSHQIMDTNPDEEFSPNSYLLRACSGPQQASSSGKETLWCLNMWCFVCDTLDSPAKKMTMFKWDLEQRCCGEASGEMHLSLCNMAFPKYICWRSQWLERFCSS